jgi:hypothetical protein
VKTRWFEVAIYSDLIRRKYFHFLLIRLPKGWQQGGGRRFGKFFSRMGPVRVHPGKP